MDPERFQNATDIGPPKKLLVSMVGADIGILKQSPQRDVDMICATALLLIFAMIFQGSEFALVAHLVFAQDGRIHPSLIAGAIFLASMIAYIDSFVFLRSHYFAAGLAELRRGGLELAGGAAEKVRMVISLIVRVILSLGLASLTALFAGLIVFHAEISSEIDRQYKSENSVLIAAATQQIDDRIKRAVASEQSQEAHVAALKKQVTAMRDGAVNPTAGAAAQSQQQEIDQLAAVKDKRDAELAASQAHASDELAGVKGDPTNSGIAGRGPRRRAAEERVKAVQTADDAASKDLAEARSRLEKLREHMGSTDAERAHQAQLQLPQLEQDLKAQTEQLAALRAEETGLTEHRDDAIRATVENAPDHVQRNQGLLTQLSALKQVSDNDPEIKTVILLIHISAMAMELCMVIATSITYIPTTYSALLVSDHWVRVAHIANGMAAEINGGGKANANDNFPYGMPANDNATSTAPMFGSGLTHGLDEPPPQPPKRPRGRPRKNILN